MTYLDDLAGKIRRQVPPHLLPAQDAEPLFRLYAVLLLAKGTAVTASDVHNAWAAWMQEHDPDHRSIMPFDDLGADTQAFDVPFAEAIKSVADNL